MSALDIFTAARAALAVAERAMDANPCEETGTAYVRAARVCNDAEQAYRATLPEAPMKPRYAARQSFAAASASWRRR